MNNKKPYFLWDYDLTEEDVHRILHGKNEWEKRWMMGRILTNAHFNDVWKYLKPKEIALELPNLRMRPWTIKSWQRALSVWGYYDQPAK